ncbi:MAG: phosphodiester glycosidase family protein [Pyrinomonadaceae bacterium]
MKKYCLGTISTGTVLSRSLLLIFLCLCVSAVNLPAQDFRAVADGVEYAEVTREISGLKVNMNLLRLDLKKVRLDVHHANDMAIGTEKTSAIAARHRAFAAINAGFFRLDQSAFAGDPVGALMIDGHLFSENINNRTTLRISNGDKATSIWIERLEIASWFGINKSEFSGRIHGINRERSENEKVAYTTEFGESTPIRRSMELVFANCSAIETFSGKEFRCRSAAASPGDGTSTIPKDGFVVSMSLAEFIASDGRLDNYLNNQGANGHFYYLRPDVLQDGKRVQIQRSTDIIAGVPQLIKNSKIDITWEQEKASKSFVETRHPRTAVAKLKDGKFLMITVDGRSESSGGIDLYDLAKLLLELGATDAMNLDGGGSTTMFLDGKVVNRPSDKEGERKVSDAILVTLRKRQK